MLGSFIGFQIKEWGIYLYSFVYIPLMMPRDLFRIQAVSHENKSLNRDGELFEYLEFIFFSLRIKMLYSI